MNKYQPLLNKYTNSSNKNNKNKSKENYINSKTEDFINNTNNIKNNQTCLNNNTLSISIKNNIIKKKKENNIIIKHGENITTNLTYKSFPLTSNNTANIIKNKKNSKIKNKTKSKSTTKTKNINKYITNKKTKTKNCNEKQNSKSQSNPKNKKKNKSSNKYKEYNSNIYINRLSLNKKQKNIININIIYNNKKSKLEKRNIENKKNDLNKKNNHNINNFIINIFPNKGIFPESNTEFHKTIKNNINLTTSEFQSNSKGNKYIKTSIKNYKLYTDNTHNIKKYDSNNKHHLKDDMPFVINNKDSFYFNELSKKLTEKIKKYGKEHNYKEYPKTDLSFYLIGRSIGHGAFGKVNIALHVLSGHIVSIKSFNKKKNLFTLNKIKNEVKIMNKLRKSDNIVKLFEYFETKDYYCLVMENVAGGNLLNVINKMNKIPENISKIIFKQLIHTLHYMHLNNIVHRDIKPDNILLDLDNTLKLCDFGVSKIIPKGQLINDSCGTPAFIAPEILKEKPYDPYAADVWSSGVVLYVMVNGFFPFRGVNESQLHESILNGQYPKPKDVSNELNDLLSKILDINPNSRITIEQILEHAWIKNGNDDSIKNNKNNKNNSINLFTKAEKIIYGKLKLNYKKNFKDIQLENFTNKNIDSYYEEENKNIQTMSFVFTPYNTNREKDEDEDLYYDDVNIEDNIINFTPKIQEISRLYEIHNNYEFDQGYIIEKKELWRKRLKVSLKNSFEDDKNKSNNKGNNKEDIFDMKNNSNNSNILKINVSMNKDKLILDEEGIKYVENFGYKKEYIIQSIETNTINHATATYYLKLSLKKQKNL